MERIIYKKNKNVIVYRNIDEPNYIYKKYLAKSDYYPSSYDLELKRTKLLDTMNKKDWPKFIIRPIEVDEVHNEHLITKYPYIEGIELSKYLAIKDMSLIECAYLIKNLEDKVMKSSNYVVPDISNINNLMITKINNKIDFIVIDPDDVQFDNYVPFCVSSTVVPCFQEEKTTRGMKKCLNGKQFNKQLDIRSMYGILYAIFNGEDYFYPFLYERQHYIEYEKLLESLGIPEDSSLYRKTLNTLNNNIENETIGDSIYELIEDGYTFNTYDINEHGYQHKLIKK